MTNNVMKCSIVTCREVGDLQDVQHFDGCREVRAIGCIFCTRLDRINPCVFELCQINVRRAFWSASRTQPYRIITWPLNQLKITE